LILVICAPSMAQISPGPLSHAHQQWEGITKCGTCHDFGKGARAFTCLDCHTEIRRRLEAKSGFHARVFNSEVGQKDCTRCHMEHNGEGYILTRLDRKGFDHFAKTGFALTGKHLQQKCESCHNEKKIAPSARPEIKIKDHNRSFLGLGRDCLSCHQDQHQGQFSADCARCHSQDAWKPAPGFSHSRASFPLTGLHAAVACAKCHSPRGGEKTQRYKGLAFGSCQNCHNDPHRGGFQEAKFRGNCDTCHNTNGWKNNRPGAGFNHNATKFTLAGKHLEVACAKCHKSADFQRPVAHATCHDCHQDIHRGQFAARAAGSDCSACHVETGFKPARFDRDAHRQTAFPLEGKHAALPCTKCHQPEGRAASYKTGKLTCAACHADRHAGELAADCDRCHTQAAFRPATFTPQSHSQTRFALTGQHASVECGSCHKPIGIAASERKYRFAATNCATCHKDPHATKLACETCHTTAQWKAVLAFDHATTQFPLNAAHGNVKCQQCHTPAVTFARTGSQCASCHLAKDVHAGQFRASSAGDDCARCHTAEHWDKPQVDHDKTEFALDVAHRNVACAKCHKEEAAVNGKPVRRFHDTPKDCVKCH
jgi:hypothetical protein